MSEPSFGSGFLAGQYTIDGYGAGGFTFGHVSHRGSILMVPEGVHIWSATQPSEITAESLAPVFAAPTGTIDLLLIGTGADLVPVPRRCGRRSRRPASWSTRWRRPPRPAPTISCSANAAASPWR